MSLQELIARGRLTFSGAPERLRVFQLVNGRLDAKRIARLTRRRLSNTLRDLQKLRELELISPRRDPKGHTVKKDDSVVYEKVPLARQIPLSYFRGVPKKVRSLPGNPKGIGLAHTTNRMRGPTFRAPSDLEVLDTARSGEDQVNEFKAAGTESRKISKEIAAFVHTREGGVLYYGIDDDGTISGADVSRQAFDQQVQNSVRNMIKPPPHVVVKAVKPMGTEILLVLVPPWDRRTVHFFEDRIHIRKGTNVFAASPEEVRRLHRGEYIT